MILLNLRNQGEGSVFKTFPSQLKVYEYWFKWIKATQIVSGFGKEVDEVTSKTQMLNKLIENDPGEVAKFGARHPTLGYAVMKPVNHKHCNKSRIYYYIKYDGYKSDRGTQKEVFAWMRANREYHGE